MVLDNFFTIISSMVEGSRTDVKPAMHEGTVQQLC